MEKAPHEWIDNYVEFEAVLRCLNELEAWDRDVAVRAFQTFGWDDASTPGNDLVFSHIESGVTVNYDGAVVAIGFDNNDLAGALPDLFLVLNGLGWRLAEVFHNPPETMNALLADMGKAIPAQMDFDVRPADAGRAISSFPEGATLVARGKEALQMMAGTNTVSETMLDELASMGTEALGTTVATPPVRTPIVLDDDEPPVIPSLEGAGAGHASRAPVAQEQKPAPALHTGRIDLEEPQPFVLPAAGGTWETETPPSIAPPRPTPALAEPGDAHHQGNGETHAAAEVQRPAAANNRPQVKEAAAASAEHIDDPIPEHVVKVGGSVFCFDLPNAMVSDHEVQQVASLHRIRDVVHLRPGASGETVRWDVFAEIDTGFPWFAEQLAGAMGFVDQDRFLVANAILKLKTGKAFPELRDLLAYRGEPETGSGNESLSVNGAHASDTTSAINRVLGSLKLCPAGKAFVDMRSGSEELAEAMDDAFSVKDLAQAATGKLFVVHVDVLDGPLVGWMADLLRFVVDGYAKSSRYKAKAEVLDAEAVKEQEILELKGTLAAALGGGVIGQTLTRLRELGVDV